MAIDHGAGARHINYIFRGMPEEVDPFLFLSCPLFFRNPERLSCGMDGV